MSLKLNSGGGGSVTLQEPVTASALTLNLPAVNGTVVTTGDSGSVSTAMLADSSVTAAKVAAGAIVQVVQTVKSDTATLTSTSFIDVPGMSVTITPSSSANRVLIQFVVHCSYINMGVLQLVRGSTVIGSSPVDGSRNVGISGSLHNGGDNNAVYAFPMTYIDTPATTSATTYKLQVRNETLATWALNRSVNDTNSAVGTRMISTITAMEVRG